MKRLALLAIIVCAWFQLSPVHAQFNGCSSFCGTSSSAIADGPGFNNFQASGGGGGASPSYTLAGTFSSSVSGDIISTTMNVGTAAANRIIVIGGASQNNPVIASATVNGVSCTLNVHQADTGIFSCPGASYGSGVQTITVTWTSSSFFTRGIAVWIASNCASSTVVHTAANTTVASAISVTSGDLMFSTNFAASATQATYSSSTQTPSNTGLLATNVGGYADWLIAATNASFSLTPQVVTGLGNYAAATYH